MSGPIGSPCRISYDANGVELVPGDVLRSEAGSCYLIDETRALFPDSRQVQPSLHTNGERRRFRGRARSVPCVLELPKTGSDMSGPLDCLFDPALAGLYPMEPDEVNRFLVKWEHKLGPCNRPFRQEGFALMVGAEPIAVAMSASIVHGPVDGYRIQEVVELARMCACERWANRLMLRLWREVAAPKWACWPVKAAVSYSKNSDHNGNLYRFDGWRKVKDDCGSNGGGTWSRKRYASDAVQGPKTLWMWDYPSPTAQPPPPASGIHGEGQPGTPHGTGEKCSLADGKD